jgi:pimeloyl-ACP methyl ester carboxylesterase
MKRVRGLHALLHDAVDSVVNLVEQTHANVARKQLSRLDDAGLGEGARAAGELHDGIARTVYESVRMVNRGIEALGSVAVEAAERSGLGEALLGHASAAIDPAVSNELKWWSDTAQSALNAWVGDFLAQRENGLSLPFELFLGGEPLPCTREALLRALPAPSSKICLFVHGLGCTEAAWSFRAQEQFGERDANYGAFLARDLGYTPLYVRYNTGLHISQNGRALSELLERLLQAYPVEVDEIALIGHSMGGLVSRSAAHYAQLEQRSWLRKLSHLLCIGSPNLGASLERATSVFAHLLNRFDTAGTQVPAKLLNMRSAGIKDLRFGYILDEDWTGKDPDSCLTDERHDVPMVPFVTYGFVAATFLDDPGHPIGHLLGDLLVSVQSASGVCPEGRHVRFDIGGDVVLGVHHIAMLNHPQVYAQVRRLLASRVLEVEGQEVVSSLAAGSRLLTE